MSEIFVSYAAEDRARVKRIVDALATAEGGWAVWWDFTILPGENWHQRIESQLDAAKCVVVIWTRASVRSHWVLTEANEGLKKGVLVPAFLDDVQPPLAFRIIQGARLFAGFDTEINKLVSAVGSTLQRSTAGSAAEKPRPHEKSNPREPRSSVGSDGESKTDRAREEKTKSQDARIREASIKSSLAKRKLLWALAALLSGELIVFSLGVISPEMVESFGDHSVSTIAFVFQMLGCVAWCYWFYSAFGQSRFLGRYLLVVGFMSAIFWSIFDLLGPRSVITILPQDKVPYAWRPTLDWWALMTMFLAIDSAGLFGVCGFRWLVQLLTLD